MNRLGPAGSGDALDPGRSVAVTASAGSGKTWLLVSRVVRLLLEGQASGGILALTFTRKAAAEMRERVNERLRLLAYGEPAQVEAELALLGLQPAPDLLQRARGLYDAQLFDPLPLRAQTLHAFCQDLLSRFALEAEVAPGFALAENEGTLYRRAWRRLLTGLHRRPDSPAAQALRRLIDLGYGEYALENLVFGFLAHRADWWAYTENQAEPLQYAMERLRQAPALADPGPAEDLDGEAFSARLKILYRWLLRAGGTRYVKTEQVGTALNAAGEERYQALLAALFKQDGERYRFQLLKASRGHLSESEIEHFETCHEEVVSAVEHQRRHHLRELCLRRTEAGLQLGGAALEALEQELQLQHALTFADLEWRSYLLLRGAGNAEWIRYKLDQKIDHLLIDEFQDTSPTQWRLLLPFLEEMAAGDAGRQRSVFIVGDAKQSIYGFRRANPALLGTAAAWLRSQLDAATVPLNDSRRSAQAVIDFVNALFEPAPLGAAIGYVRHGTHRGADWGRIELAPLIEPAPRMVEALVDALPERMLRDPLTAPRELDEITRAEQEGRQVAARIRALIEAAPAVSEGAGTRAIGYGDVMVLARSRTHLQALEQALTAAGIPYVGSSRGTLLDTAEARDLVALLRFLNAPHRSLELAQVLRSPLFSADDADLLALAAGAAERTWFEALPELAPQRPELARALELLRGWLRLAAELAAHDLLDRICREADAAARYEAALPPVAAARVRANLGAFVQLALEADSGRYPSLTRFLDYLEELTLSAAQAAGEAPDEAPPPAARGQVRVLTIHAAKGLEAPAVFLVNAGRIIAPRVPRWLIDWPSAADRPELMLLPGRNGERDACSEQLIERQQEREEREDLNLLYVAVTRARQFLHISGFRQSNQGERSSWYDHARAALQQLGNGDAAPLAGLAQDSQHYGSGEIARGSPAPADAGHAPDDPRLRRPIPAPQPVAASPSALAADAGETVDAAAALRGNAVHLLLQWLSEQPQLEDALLIPRLRSRLGGEVEEADARLWLQSARALLAVPQLNRYFDPRQYVRAWNEVPCGDGERGGVIDRLVDDGTALWILDYKTTPKADAALLAERYRPQLQAYAAALRRVWPGRPLRAGLVLTETRSWLELLRID
ncbi:MAG: UvrD-helicase domain-containing protein [Nevskia sp.]|nr:UvrD-helicase domain-containing protein [Nevskia sp.]